MSQQTRHTRSSRFTVSAVDAGKTKEMQTGDQPEAQVDLMKPIHPILFISPSHCSPYP